MNGIKRSRRGFSRSLALSMAGLAAPSAIVRSAAAAPTGRGKPIPLFNGKDLSGWVWVPRKPGSSRLEDVWSVVDGKLRCKGKPDGYIRTERTFTSFVLTMKIRHLTQGNGGVLLRVVGPDKVWPKSIEAQGQAGALGDIWNIDRFPMVVDQSRTNGRHTLREKPEVKERPVGEWNDYEIVLDGGELTIRVNGVEQNRARGCEVVAGAIGLQSEGSEYEFRDILLSPLRPR